jgi:Tfp pilus assembly protein PilV
MYIMLLVGMLVLTGCETAEQYQARMAQEQAYQQWRMAHPYEAAQMDLMRAQQAQANAQAYRNLFPTYQPPQRQPMSQPRYCSTMNTGALSSTTCY